MAGTIPGYPDTVYSVDDGQTTFTLGTNSIGTSSGSSGVSTGTGITVPWVTTTQTSDTYTLNPSWSNRASSKIRLDGPEADIEINGESLVGMLKQIEQRLNILKPNPDLEKDWEELRVLGDQYRKLEEEIQAKMKTWEKLSKKY